MQDDVVPASSHAPERRQRLADGVVAEIKFEIASGALPIGAQLPTEPGMMQRFGVSRTVVREAIAELRAAGLVKVVQGAGVFVALAQQGTNLALTESELRSIPRVIEMLEYRAGLETQAALLAAQRATPADVFTIHAANDLVTRHVEQGRSAVEADRALHLAIAEATHNGLFLRALRTLGTSMIPRSLLPGQSDRPDPAYLRTVIAEHQRIVEAIAARDSEAARAAMQAHLGNSQRRYESLALLSSHAGDSTDPI